MEYYVPWNLTYLNAAWNYIKAWLGPTIIVAVICFATVFGLILIISIVRKFLKL